MSMAVILGLDLGTNSIGTALVSRAENANEKSSIIKLGVRVNPLTVDEQTNFEKGKSITTNADRTLKRSARRNLQRYKLRRENLLNILKESNIISDDAVLSEQGGFSTFSTLSLRAKSAVEPVELEEFAKILLQINKKRGYKSSRKVKSAEDGELIDGMDIAKRLYENEMTPGQYVYDILLSGKKYIPDFYRSDLEGELNRIWSFQQQFYADILTDDFKKQIAGKGKMNCSKIFYAKYSISTADNKGSGKTLQAYGWRVEALSEKIDIEKLAYVISDLNGIISNSSGYLGSISDRSKELYFNNQTVGQYLMKLINDNPNAGLKNKVFYRQDYLDEFNTIWQTQSKYHSVLTDELKSELRDVIIFYQRRLKSQKGLVSICELDNRVVEVDRDGKKVKKLVGSRVCPKSSPLFQEFKIWQILNNIVVIDNLNRQKRFLYFEEKERLFGELSYREKLTKDAVLKLLFKESKNLDLNYSDIEGNRTQAEFIKAYQTIIKLSGHGDYDFSKLSASSINDYILSIFAKRGYSTDILKFDSELENPHFERQPLYKLWHLIYSFEGDNSNTGDKKLIEKISEITGFEEEYSRIIANVNLQPDYGSLSAKAIRKIMPYLREGNEYSVACEYAGYRHSKSSLTKDEIKNRELKDKLEILPRNSLRNPVVEKILNQMVNVVNNIIETHGKPDEIHIELSRDLKSSAKEREEATAQIGKSTREHEEYRAILRREFGLMHVSRNDIIRYKLYLELAARGFRTIYSDSYLPKEKLFTKEFDIEHIIPKAKLFDDSFSNKTLERREVNIEKSDATAYDYVNEKHGEQGLDAYLMRIDAMYKNGDISKAKYNKLKMRNCDIPSDFIARDLRDSQYIAVKAKSMLEEIVRTVVSTSGSITAQLREDWQLVDVMKELNWDKYKALGLTEVIENRDGRKIRRIKDWTKRNDHRHHAVDALTVAFTKHSHVQYINNLNARSDKSGAIYAIETKELYRDDNNKLKFNPPMPLNEFRAEVKRHLEGLLVSIKAKNKVVTKNINKTKAANGKSLKTTQLTPRGQLYNETIYGKSGFYVVKNESVGSSFNEEKIYSVAKQSYREALLMRLREFGGDPKKAFTLKNSLEKSPLYIDENKIYKVPARVDVVNISDRYTIRKPVSPDIKLEKVVDVGVRRILERRLNEFGGDSKKAFSNLDENPIWLNRSKGIAIKSVTITAISNAISLHSKHDKDGKLILDENGNSQPIDFVSTGNNHHVAIYRDADGKLQENVVSFYEATILAGSKLPVVNNHFNEEIGWQFLFSMKQNEYFVFPNETTGFDPREIDLMDAANYHLISPNLFRVQKLTTKDYVFRHHLETMVEDKKELAGIVFKRLGPSKLEGIVKVRVNHIGEIVHIGEY